MSDLTVEMVQRGRGPSSEEVARRRSVSRDLRSARERLTSTSGLERAFDFELMRLYAQYRADAAIPLVLFALMLAGASTIWVPPVTAALGCACVLVVLAATTAICRRFLRRETSGNSLKRWRRIFVAGEVAQSTTWAAMIPLTVADARTFALFGLVVVAAVATMLAATVPLAAICALVPLTLAALSCLPRSTAPTRSRWC